MTKKYDFYKVANLFNSVKDEKRTIKQPPRLIFTYCFFQNTLPLYSFLLFFPSLPQFQHSKFPIKFLYHSFWSKSKITYEKT
ncbi:hypothetical protein DZ858_03145 [Marixanthomonas ophiurae]|uniref:Uncharacterized protein n=1 Tax=Marixanthomonas ophiurae TaxID=387659 RepID=A0A3E1QAD4_9FLAO|nr:hypothetical protein DZ858_03145 [Marixanthomonas ophiurae]